MSRTEMTNKLALWLIHQQSTTAACAITSQKQLHSLSLPLTTLEDYTANFYIGATTFKEPKNKWPLVIDEDFNSL